MKQKVNRKASQNAELKGTPIEVSAIADASFKFESKAVQKYLHGSNESTVKNNDVKHQKSLELRQVRVKSASVEPSPKAKNTIPSRVSHSNLRNNKSKGTKSSALKIIFLGGVGEIGKNMTALEYNDQIIIIDCGLSFPSSDMPGIDVVIPDYTYITENIKKVKGVFITHGHEDHIGALPYFLKECSVPVYGTKLTLTLIANKQKEKQFELKSKTVNPGDVIKAGCFSVEFVRVNHSVAGACALAITTPIGIVFHTGDYKIDFEPIDHNMIDLSRIAEIGKKGVLCMMGESTNCEKEGHTPSESSVGKTLEKIFAENQTRRIFIATFASNIYRVQQIIELAVKYGRKVAVVGRSMLNNIEAAIRIGEFYFDKEVFIDVDKINKYEDKEICVISTGSQGEPASALSRLASGDFNKIEIGKNDTVILSSYPIPGNESSVNRVINNLYKRGAIVIHENVHASGHACQEELKTMISLLKPKYFIPVHGEYRHLKIHSMIAESLGVKAENILIPEIGMVAEVTKNHIMPKDHVQSGERLVDGLGMGDIQSDVLRERKLLSEDGLCVVVVTVNGESGELVTEPYLITRGFIYSQEAEKLVEEAKQVLIEALKEFDFKQMKDFNEFRNAVRKPLRNFFYKQTMRTPMILPIIYKG